MRTISTPSSTASGMPVSSSAVSAPPSVSSRTLATRSAGSGQSSKEMISSAPNALAAASRLCTESMTMTRAPALLGAGGGPQAQPACTLHHDGLAGGDASAVHTGRGLRQRAAGADRDQRRNVVRDLEQRVGRADVVVRAEGPVEVRELVRGPGPLVVAVLGTRVGLSPRTGPAVPAVGEVHDRDQITGRQRHPGRVGRAAGRVDHAGRPSRDRARSPSAGGGPPTCADPIRTPRRPPSRRSRPPGSGSGRSYSRNSTVPGLGM